MQTGNRSSTIRYIRRLTYSVRRILISLFVSFGLSLVLSFVFPLWFLPLIPFVRSFIHSFIHSYLACGCLIFVQFYRVRRRSRHRRRTQARGWFVRTLYRYGLQESIGSSEIVVVVAVV